MLIGDKKSDFFFSQLAQFKVEDKNGKIIGKAGDAIFNKKDMTFNSLILFGGLLEEKMEDFGLKENIDPIVPISAIASVDQKKKKIVLNVDKSELKTTNKDFSAPEGTIQYIKLKKLAIYEKENEKIGRVIDIFFHSSGMYKFIVGGSALEEFLEKVRVIPDKDLIVPNSAIKEISDKIVLTVNKFDLLSTLENEVLNPKKTLAQEKFGYLPKGYNYNN
jgi:sporulation protein YlmC with PRC-barrel domain